MDKQQTETKVERIMYGQTCSRCGKHISGTSRKQLAHTFEMHLFYCKRTKEKEDSINNNGGQN